jgi:hypothetical protein
MECGRLDRGHSGVLARVLSGAGSADSMLIPPFAVWGGIRHVRLPIVPLSELSDFDVIKTATDVLIEPKLVRALPLLRLDPTVGARTPRWPRARRPHSSALQRGNRV